MRPYPRNSPQAAARIVALAMVADGHVCKVELDVLDRLRAYEQLGLARAEFHAVVHAVCEDLLTPTHRTCADVCRVDPQTLAQLMAEVDDPDLSLKVLSLCISVSEADGHVAKGEEIVLVAAVEHGCLHREMLQPELAERSVEHV